MLLEACGTDLQQPAAAAAAVAFLEAAAGGSFEAERGAASTPLNRICGASRTREQDDLLRFSRFTNLATQFERDLKPLAVALNIRPQVLRGALQNYAKLTMISDVLRPSVLVDTVAQWIRNDTLPTAAQQATLLDRAGTECVGDRLASVFAKVMPELIAYPFAPGGLYQQGDGTQVHMKARDTPLPESQMLLPLLPRAHAWMQRSHIDEVDAVAQFWTHVPRTAYLDERVTPLQRAVYSDSTTNQTIRRMVIGRQRDLGATTRMVLRGGFKIRDVAKAIAESALGMTATYDALIVLYQVNDRAFVSKTGEGVVARSGQALWLKHVRLLCDVLKATSTRALVVSMDACCFPAFDKVKAEYDAAVKELRQVLTEEGIAWSNGAEVCGLPCSDGWHFDVSCNSEIANAVGAWMDQSRAATRSLDADRQLVIERALAHERSRKYFWSGEPSIEFSRFACRPLHI